MGTGNDCWWRRGAEGDEEVPVPLPGGEEEAAERRVADDDDDDEDGGDVGLRDAGRQDELPGRRRVPQRGSLGELVTGDWEKGT